MQLGKQSRSTPGYRDFLGSFSTYPAAVRDKVWDWADPCRKSGWLISYPGVLLGRKYCTICRHLHVSQESHLSHVMLHLHNRKVGSVDSLLFLMWTLNVHLCEHYKPAMTTGNFYQCQRIGQDPQFCLHLLQQRLRRNLVETNHGPVKKGKGEKRQQYWMLWCSNVKMHHASWQKLNNRKP